MLNDQVIHDIDGILENVPELDCSKPKVTFYDGTPAIGVTIHSRLSRGQLYVLMNGVMALPAYVEMHLLRQGNFCVIYFW